MKPVSNTNEIFFTAAESLKSKIWEGKNKTLKEFSQRFNPDIVLNNYQDPELTLDEYLRLKEQAKLSKGEFKFDDLTPKEKGGCYILGALKDNNAGHSKGNVEYRSGVALDIDDLVSGQQHAVYSAVNALDANYIVHTTYKNSFSNPRLRIIIPLDTNIDDMEIYDRVSRHIAYKIQPSMEWFDQSTHQPYRAMLFPYIPKGSLYECNMVLDKGNICVQDILDEYEDVKDLSTLKGSSKPFKKSSANSSKSDVDPTKISGLRGVFNKLFPIKKAIERFLSDVYEPGTNGRYEHIGSTSSNGVVIYHDGYLMWSHHSSDPLSLQNGHGFVDTFEMIRVHKFGDLDRNWFPENETEKPPSYLATMDFIEGLAEVQEYNRKRLLSPEPFERHELIHFHEWSKDRSKATGVNQGAIEEYIRNTLPLIVVDGKPFIYIDGVYKPDSGEILKTAIKKLIMPEKRTAQTIKSIYQMIIDDANLNTSFDQIYSNLNAFKINGKDTLLINFRNGFYDVKSGQTIPHSPDIISINQIPHDYDPKADCPKFKEYINTGAPDPDDQSMLLNFMGYGLTADTKQQKMLFIKGEAGSGKSVLLDLMQRILGAENYATVPPEYLSDDNTHKFAKAQLAGKLMDIVNDIKTTALKDSSIIKRMTGEDTIFAEFKGKDHFTFKNAAKLIFTTNEMPLFYNEASEAVYRRLLIVDWKKFSGNINLNLKDELTEEIPGIIVYCVQELTDLYMFDDGIIKSSSNSDEEIQKLRRRSDIVQYWIEARTYYNAQDIPEKRVNRKDLYADFDEFCFSESLKGLRNKNDFYSSLESKGFSLQHSGGLWYYRGLYLND